jgi:UDP-glucose 4-epimerase
VRILGTGSSRHLGDALVRVLGADGHDVVGLDVLASPSTSVVGSIADRACVRRCVDGVDAVISAATLHKPHVGSHTRQAFIDTHVTGTLSCSRRRSRPGLGASCSPARRAPSGGH